LSVQLRTPLRAVVFPWVVLMYFRDAETGRIELHAVRQRDGLSLSKLAALHGVYARVMAGARVDPAELDALLARPPLYGPGLQLVMAFLSTGSMCILAYGGSFVEALVSGLISMATTFLQQCAGCNNSMYASLFECVPSSRRAGPR
jgi:uncharacterized membrane protein YjjP (DUF1212 family)